jgi:hypothetical protein
MMPLAAGRVIALGNRLFLGRMQRYLLAFSSDR